MIYETNSSNPNSILKLSIPKLSSIKINLIWNWGIIFPILICNFWRMRQIFCLPYERNPFYSRPHKNYQTERSNISACLGLVFIWWCWKHSSYKRTFEQQKIHQDPNLIVVLLSWRSLRLYKSKVPYGYFFSYSSSQSP